MSAPSAQIVSLGAAGAPAAERAAAAAAALGAAGLDVGARIFVEEEGVALDRALALTETLALIIAGPAGSGAEAVCRALARLAGTSLVFSEGLLAALTDAAARHDRPLPRRDDRMALLPKGAIVWTVPGSEPGWALECGERVFVVLPRDGLIERLLEQQLPSLLHARLPGRAGLAARTLKIAGVPLAEIESRLSPWLGAGGDVQMSTVADEGEAWVRLRARGATATAAAEALAVAEAKVLARLGEDCYGRDDDTLERVIGRLLVERALTLAVAESCTGGLVGHRLTNVPGSSAYFERGVVVYSNRAKHELLGVPDAMLRAHGAVSGPTAEAMARGICVASGSGCGLAVTGIAGPDGGTPTKPVGTVFIGVAVGDEVRSHRFVFPGDRAAVKWQSAQAALDLLRRSLLLRPVQR